MSCQQCGAPLVLRGSMSRGVYVCTSCTPSTEKSKVMKRYESEVRGWHRTWCAAIQARKAGRADPKLCDCGHDQQTPHTHQQIEQRERAAYGDAA